MATRLTHARRSVSEAFDQATNPVFRERDIRMILESRRSEWKLAASTSLTDFIQFLLANGTLKRIRLDLPHRAETLYVWGKVSRYAIAVSVKPKAYLCQQTAMRLHGLTNLDTPVLYVNSEQRPLPPPDGPLEQTAIDRAFRGRQRETHNRAKMGKDTVCVLNGKHVAQLGVVSINDPDGRPVRVTGIARTLIDITVRPVYAGGMVSVLEAFRKAHGRFSVKELSTMLEKLDYVYPYHQSIGFYLDRSGKYTSGDLKHFRKEPFEYDFYLGYNIKEREYSPDWRVYFPANL